MPTAPAPASRTSGASVPRTASRTSPAASMIGIARASSIQGMTARTRSTSPPEHSSTGARPSARNTPLSKADLPEMICARRPVR